MGHLRYLEVDVAFAGVEQVEQSLDNLCGRGERFPAEEVRGLDEHMFEVGDVHGVDVGDLILVDLDPLQQRAAFVSRHLPVQPQRREPTAEPRQRQTVAAALHLAMIRQSPEERLQVLPMVPDRRLDGLQRLFRLQGRVEGEGDGEVAADGRGPGVEGILQEALGGLGVEVWLEGEGALPVPVDFLGLFVHLHHLRLLGQRQVLPVLQLPRQAHVGLQRMLGLQSQGQVCRRQDVDDSLLGHLVHPRVARPP